VFDPAPAPEPPVAVQERVLPGQRLGAMFQVLLCSGFPTQLFIIAVLTALGMNMRTEIGELSPAFIVSLSMADTVLVIMLVFFFFKAQGERPRDVLIGKRIVWREALLGCALLPLVFGLVILILAVILTVAPGLHNVPRNPLEDMLQTRGDAVRFGVVAMIAGGVREEIQRCFILHRFEQFLGGGSVGVVVYSTLFGLGHIEQGFDAAIATAALGAFWGAVYLARRSIVAPMVSHAGFNLAQLMKYLMLQ
jgi:membrane protease YdiL (CAAX protease family)